MNKAKFFLSVIFSLSFISSLHAQNILFDWKHMIGNGQRNSGTCIATDSSGFVYVGGMIRDTITFLDTTFYYGDGGQAFIAKLTPDGNRVWIRMIRSKGAVVESMCFDKENSLYIAGYYSGYAQIEDTLLKSNNVDSLSLYNGFIAKFNIEGELIWASSNSMFEYFANGMPVKKLTVDNYNNIILSGYCADEIEYFDTTITINTLDSVWVTTPYGHWVSYQGKTGFVAKYSKDGEKLWVKAIDIGPMSIKCDNENNILIISTFSETVTFDTITLLPLNSTNIVLVKFNSAGSALWAERAGGSGYYNHGVDVAIDDDDNVYITGSMYGNDVYFGENIQFPFSVQEAFVAKYTKQGSFQWVVPIGTTHITGHSAYNFGCDILVKNSNLYFLGWFDDSLNYNSMPFINTGVFDVLLLQLDMSGNVIKAGQYGESGWMYPQGLALDSNSDIYFICDYQINGPDYEIIIAKIPFDLPINVYETSLWCKADLTVYPNPGKGVFKLHFMQNTEEKYFMEIFDINGSVVFENELTDSNAEIDVSYLNKGMYILRAIAGNKVITTKFIIE